LKIDPGENLDRFSVQRPPQYFNQISGLIEFFANVFCLYG
jgi:hypothetical protein